MECFLSIDPNNIDTVCDGQDVQSLTPLNANTKFDVTYNVCFILSLFMCVFVCLCLNDFCIRFLILIL